MIVKIGDHVKQCPVCFRQHQNVILVQKNIREALCESCWAASSDPETNGIGGTDNISVLFPEKPSAVGLPPQPEVVQALEQYSQLAADGKITGLILCGFADDGQFKTALTGKITFSAAVSVLEKLKFSILAGDFSQTGQVR